MLSLLGCGQGQNGAPLLLDIYGSASAAYSLRKLRTTYTGSAIRVRRASDNTETDIGFVNNELDTSTLTSFCSGTNGFVTTWYDQSGNARNRTQATAANQPQIVSSGIVILDGTKPAILNNLNSTLNTTSFITTQPATKFIIARSLQNSGNKVLSGSLDINARHQLGYVITNGGQYSIFAGVSLTSSVTNMLNTKALTYSLYNGENSKIGVNNIITSGNAGTFNNDGIATGALTFSFDGRIQEEIYYPSDQSINRLQIQTNINSYYLIY